MPYLLRKVTYGRWETENPPAWLPKDELLPSFLFDLRPEKGGLSLWWIADDKSNLDRVIAAFATMLDSLSNFDYILIAEDVVHNAGFSISNTLGNTPDDEVNRLWHRDVAELSLTRLVEFARVLQAQKDVLDRIEKKIVKSMILTSLSAGNLDVSRIRPKVKAELGLADLEKYPITLPSKLFQRISDESAASEQPVEEVILQALTNYFGDLSGDENSA